MLQSFIKRGVMITDDQHDAIQLLVGIYDNECIMMTDKGRLRIVSIR